MTETLAEPGPQLAPGPRPDRIALSYSQQQFWLAGQIDDSNGGNRSSMVFRLRGRLDAAALRGALHDVVVRHESLRTVLSVIDGQPYQTILGPGEAHPALQVVLLSTACYAIPHLCSGSWLLLGVVLICGVIWSSLRVMTGSLVVPLLTHLVWDLGVFVMFPLE